MTFGYVPTVMAPTTKPWAATRMWIRCNDIFVSPRLFIFSSLYPTMAKNPAIPEGAKRQLNLHQLLTENKIL